MFKVRRQGRHLKIKNKIILFVFILLTVVLFTFGLLVERLLVTRFEERLKRNALDIALAVSQIPDVKEHVGKENGHLVIQSVAEAIRTDTSADFVVVMDMNSIRYSHPVPERIGQKFVGGDEGPSLRGETYTSWATGTLGRSLRAFVPIFRGDRQVGAVSVGIMADEINIIIGELRQWIFLAALAGLTIGMVASGYLAANIKQAMFGLEPHEISALFKEREAILNSVREGIVVVNSLGRIVFTNGEARRLLDEKAVGKEITSILPAFPLQRVLGKGLPAYDVEFNLVKGRVLSNSVPIRSEQGQILGAILSFRDMTEIRKLAEELTGMMRFVETLRVQNHEFNNKLHTISGLIQLGEHDKAVQFISKAADSHRKAISLVSERVKDLSVAAVLLGKLDRSRAMDIELLIDSGSFLADLRGLEGTTLATIIANLVDNAMEAVNDNSEGKRVVKISLYDENDGITISVKDTGPGIPPELRDKIFEKGFTGKREHPGLGLFIVKTHVESLNGELDVESEEGTGTDFSVYIPHNR